MRDSSQYRELAQKIHDATTEFYNSFKWVQEMEAGQMASHRITQMVNVDCHNGYMAGLIQKLAGQKPWRLQHKSYNKILYEVSNDIDNSKSYGDVPNGLLFRRVVPEIASREGHSRPVGKLALQVKGTLFTKRDRGNRMINICKGSITENRENRFHPYYWDVPTVDQILKVFQFATQSEIDLLVRIHGGAS